MTKSPETIRARQDTIDHVLNRLDNESGRAFPNVREGNFRDQLCDRIEHPKLINQGKLDFCGPAAVLYALAKDDVRAYADLALDLFTRGIATVRGSKIDAGFLKNESPPKDMDIGCCDWLMLACIRSNVGFGALTAVTNLAQGTFPFEIATSLRNLGYRDVINDTYSTIAWKADHKHFLEAERLLRSGYRVILCVNGNMFKDPYNSSAISLLPNHFCTLKQVIDSSDFIECRVWQWGNANKEPSTAGTGVFVNLPTPQFVKHYFGYIAGGDLQ